MLVKIEEDPLNAQQALHLYLYTDPFKPRTDESLALCHPYCPSTAVL